MTATALNLLNQLASVVTIPRKDAASRDDIIDVPENADYLISDLCGMEKLDNEAARVGSFVRFSFDTIKEMFNDKPVENTIFYAGFLPDDNPNDAFDAAVDCYVFHRKDVFAMLLFTHDKTEQEPLIAITKGQTDKERKDNLLVMHVRELQFKDRNGNTAVIFSEDELVYQKQPNERGLPLRDCNGLVKPLLLTLERLTRVPKVHWVDVGQDEYPPVETSATPLAISYTGSWSK